MKGIPFLFRRIIKDKSGKEINIYVVKKTKCFDYKYYESSWMDDRILSRNRNTDDDYCVVPDVDMTEENFVFDNERDAFIKMKELWDDVIVD